MGEKSELLKLFKKAADSADMFKDDKQEVERSEILSEKGKHQEIAENRGLFAEAVEGYREQMLAIVDRRKRIIQRSMSGLRRPNLETVVTRMP